MRIRNVPLRAFGPFSRYRGMAGFNFGTVSPTTGRDCPVGGSWEAWCDCVWPQGGSDAALNQRCRNWAPFAPWTDVGAGIRGIPHAGAIAALTGGALQIVSSLTGGAVQGPPQPPMTSATSPVQSVPVVVTGATSTTTSTTAADEPSIFGIPKTIAYVGGGVLALGALALALSGRK